MLCRQSLLQMPAFRTLPETRLDWICERAKQRQLAAGEVLVREGDRPLGFFIQTRGVTAVSRLSDGIDMLIGQHESPTFFGEIQVLTEDRVPVTLTAVTEAELYHLNCPDFLEVMHSCREFERDIFRTVSQRLRGLESFVRTREKLAALGTLSAGLAHELNNPAAALVRILQDVQPAILELQRMNLVYGQQQVDEAHTQDWLNVRDRGFDAIAQETLDPITRSDREDALLDWLEDYEVAEAWTLAEPLAMGAVSPETLTDLTQRWQDDPTELRDMGIRWLALSFEVMGLVRHGLQGAERISELVQSMKSYSYMDQAAQQEIDIHQGLEDTLRLLAFKLKQGIQVKRDYAPQLPKVMAFGSELNQVWTNLIDNAIYALQTRESQGQATITIRTALVNQAIVVEIEDNGPGFPAELANRIFEPFFTTKPMGQGSGLGLDLVRRVVENRHGGSLSVQSVPGQTCFQIRLPLSPAAVAP